MGGASPAEGRAVEADSEGRLDRSEFVLRRIHWQHVAERNADPILRIAFQPNKNDTAGLSVVRERLCGARELVASAPQPATEYYVVRLPVSELQDAGFTLRSDPLTPPDPAGHMLIPEITFQRLKETRPSS